MARRRTWLLVALGVLLAVALPGQVAAHGGGADGAVYTQTNEASGNKVIAWERDEDGSLDRIGRFGTGGRGSGDALGSQGALALSRYGDWLLAVNAGSDDVSSFLVRSDGSLRLVDRESSGGDRPISVTVHDHLVYVLNAGGSGNISGLVLDSNGRLRPLSGSTRPLSGAAADPAQVSFDPAGKLLVVTEKATNLIDTFRVRDNGRPGAFKTFPSAGPTPFGFAFDRWGRLFVSEAAGGAPNASSTSSYDVSMGGALTVISPAVPTTQTAACWVVVTDNGRFAYVTNTGSGTVSSYGIANNGSITLRAAVAASTGAGSAPTDAALSDGSRYLYVLEDGSDSISFYRVRNDGSLTPLGEVTGLPATSVGLAAS